MSKSTEEPFSNSTMDSPPWEPEKNAKIQKDFFVESEHEGRVCEFISSKIPEHFSFCLSLTLKPTKGNYWGSVPRELRDK